LNVNVSESSCVSTHVDGLTGDVGRVNRSTSIESKRRLFKREGYRTKDNGLISRASRVGQCTPTRDAPDDARRAPPSPPSAWLFPKLLTLRVIPPLR